jgi:integrase
MTIAYNVSQALLGLGEDKLRRKGEQDGSVFWNGRAWHIRFRQWQADEQRNLKYVQVSRRIAGEYPHNANGRRLAASAGYDQWVINANQASKAPAGLATVEQFYETRFQVDHIDQLKKNGRNFYRTMWQNHIRPTLGHVQLKEVTRGIVQALISAKIATGLSPQTIRHIRNCISAIFRHAQNLEFYDGVLPTQGLKLPALVHKERQALTWEQVQVLALVTPVCYRNLITLLWQTGMRIGEATGLRWSHVNLSDDWRLVDAQALPPNSLLVNSAWVRNERTTTKNKRWRIIPLTSESWVAVMQQYEASRFRGEDHSVFTSRVGTPLDAHNFNRRMLKKAAKECGLSKDLSVHCLRHTTATMADKVGLSVADKMKVLGHSTPGMSVHYTHPEIERVRQAMERMSNKVQ